MKLIKAVVNITIGLDKPRYLFEGKAYGTLGDYADLKHLRRTCSTPENFIWKRYEITTNIQP